MTGHSPGTALRGATATATPADGSPSRRARADCTADRAGGLTFDVRLTGRQAARPPADAALLLRLRKRQGPADTVRLPLAPAAADGRLRAVLPGTMWLQEGRWDACLVLGDGKPRRLLPGVHDLRALIDRVPCGERTWLGVRIPYATKYGNLTVRSWLREPHAECGPLRVADGSMVLRGTLHGARLSPGACLEAHPRDSAAPPVSVPVPLDGQDAAAESAPSPGRGSGEVVTGKRRPASVFTARLPLDALPPGRRVWNLWLRPSADEGPVRLARILDDVADKKRIFSYPPQHVTGPGGSTRSVRPYYTLDNDLSVRVSCEDQG
ncbi:hypothetical protein [Streptomyces abyssalis]|uniref:hypothetical protein n=1 Tax=Streptomyces abyssalis TaxID=933944 RepID=UPI000A7647F3|nr:hypothetical protein [Streptomyces abyssalis]